MVHGRHTVLIDLVSMIDFFYVIEVLFSLLIFLLIIPSRGLGLFVRKVNFGTCQVKLFIVLHYLREFMIFYFLITLG